MAFSFRITEEYCAASLALELAGYEWQPRPGDWMLDRDDASIGMLTLPVRDGAQIRKLNTHIPTYIQVGAMLDENGVNETRGQHVEFRVRGRVIAKFSLDEFAADEGLCRLRALVAALQLKAQSPRG
ncbi:hypothetical protein PLCT1_01924 [Planctomycetaceae bacterium]|nr:hypothetical protein PLCT1_01924 [Planctomycetaceae bacterium]